MLYWFQIASRESALKTIRRTSGLFILLPVIVIGLSSFDFFDSWLKYNARATPRPSLETVSGLIGYMVGKIARNDWAYILILVNAIYLRRKKSRVAATLFVLASLYGVGLGLFMSWSVLSGILPQQLFLFTILTTVVSVFVFLIAARTLAAAIKLQGEFADDPIAG